MTAISSTSFRHDVGALLEVSGVDVVLVCVSGNAYLMALILLIFFFFSSNNMDVSDDGRRLQFSQPLAEL